MSNFQYECYGVLNYSLLFDRNKDVVTVFVQIITKIKCWKSIHIRIKLNALGKTTNKVRMDRKTIIGSDLSTYFSQIGRFTCNNSPIIMD